MTQLNTPVESRTKYSILGLTAVSFFCLSLFCISFYLTVRTDRLYLKEEGEGGRLLCQEIERVLNKAGFFPIDEKKNPLCSYRLSLSSQTQRETGYVIGRIPLLVAVNFWNPVNEITVEQLSAILRGEITNWKPLNGKNMSIKFVLDPESKEILSSNFSHISLNNNLNTLTGKELVDTLLNDPGAIAVLPWFSVKPSIKVVGVQAQGGAVNPFWSEDPEKDYPLTAEVRIVPSSNDSIFHTIYHFIQKSRVERIISEHFSAGKWLVGGEISTLAAAGDILFDRKVARTAKEKGDIRYPFLETAEIFRRADLAFANLECPLSTRGNQINMFRGNPVVTEALAYAGFNVISLANNHIFDYGLVAFLDTMECLQEKGIVHIGVGENIYEARKPRILNVNGVKVAFLAYTQIGKGFTYTRVPQHWAATADLPGVAEARSDYVRMDVARAKSEADLVFVSFHWGNEYVHYPTGTQKALGRTALAAGADLVIGHHPHVLQGIEFRGGGIIAYSLGNFVFDQITLERRQSVILKAAFDDKGVRQLRLVPVFITEEQPRSATGKMKRDIIDLMAEISKNNCEEEN